MDMMKKSEIGDALRKYQDMKKFKNEKHAMIPDDRMLILQNDECGTIPLKENQPIKIIVTGVVGKPKKEGYPIRIDYAKMDDDEGDDIEEKDRPIVSPSA